MQRINKRQARKAFAENKTLYLQSSNMPFNSIWQSAYKVTPSAEWEKGREVDYKQFELEINGQFAGYDNEALNAFRNNPVYSEDEKNRAFDRLYWDYAYYNCDRERGLYIHFYVE